MSVKASVASMALSGCPEAGALRCRPEVADRNLDAPQLQKLEEIVERVERVDGASLVQVGTALADGWTVISDITSAFGGNRKDLFKKDATSAASDPSGEVWYNRDGSRLSFKWKRGDSDLRVTVTLERELKNGLPCRINGGDDRDQINEENMWTALRRGQVLAMGAEEPESRAVDQHGMDRANPIKLVFVAVRTTEDIQAYEFGNFGKAGETASEHWKVRKVHYNETEKKFYP